MNNVTFLLSMPGGSEWLLVLIVLAVFIVAPVLAIVYYLETKRLRKENQELRNKLDRK